MTKEQLKAIKEKYPRGTRVVLIKMDDVQAPPINTKGTVIGVDDLGSLLMDWDNGSSLNVLYGEDKVEILRYCPKCNKEYIGYPAISREDNETEICSECGTKEAIDEFMKWKKQND